MKRLLLAALIAVTTISANAEPAMQAPSKSAHLLAPEYRDPALLKPYAWLQDAIDFNAPIPALKKLNARALEAAKADKVQPSDSITAPRRGTQPSVAMHVYRPETSLQGKAPVIYFIHGGGYIMGNARMNNAGLFDLAERSRAVVVSVEYRLATDAPFPADIDDTYHGLSHLFEHADKLGLDPRKIVIMGESAGGGLAARLALKTRDIGKYRPAGQVLVYPMLDHRTGTKASPHKNPHAGEFLWTARLNRLGWRTLRGGQTIPEKQMPYYSAATAKNLRDLPRTFMMVGTLDLFANEDIDYANRLVKAGVPTDFLLIDGVYHAFELIRPDTPQTQRYLKARTDAIQRMFDAAER